MTLFAAIRYCLHQFRRRTSCVLCRDRGSQALQALDEVLVIPKILVMLFRIPVRVESCDIGCEPFLYECDAPGSGLEISFFHGIFYLGPLPVKRFHCFVLPFHGESSCFDTLGPIDLVAEGDAEDRKR